MMRLNLRVDFELGDEIVFLEKLISHELESVAICGVAHGEHVERPVIQILEIQEWDGNSLVQHKITVISLTHSFFPLLSI